MGIKIVLMDKINDGKTNGRYLYNETDQEDCKIIISKDSDDPSKTLIHECIHHTIREMKNNPEMEKLAHRIFRREDFVNSLAINLSKQLKFEVVSSKP